MTTPIYVPSQGPSSWQQFLADPEKQWKTGYSAKSLAYCWEEANGFPTSIRQTLASSSDPGISTLEPLMIIPEHKVPLPGGSTQSQNDAFVLARSDDTLAAITIEGKVSESFGQLVSEWGPDTSPGKTKRFQYLLEKLGLDNQQLDDVYYQLLHRTASALIEAERFHADVAIMLVHSFSQEHIWFEEFSRFALALGVTGVELNQAYFAGIKNGKKLYIGWSVGEARFLER